MERRENDREFLISNDEIFSFNGYNLTKGKPFEAIQYTSTSKNGSLTVVPRKS